MRRSTLASALALLSAPAAAPAGMTFDLVPSGPGIPANGLEFPSAGDGRFTLTNTLANRDPGPTGPLYLDFSIGYDHTDAAGDVFFAQSGTRDQLYILDRPLAPDGSSLPHSDAIANAVFLGASEAVNLGGGLYRYTAGLVGSDVPGGAGPLDTPAELTMTFDVTRELGHQVVSGSLTFGEPGVNAVPEPGSWCLAGLGLALAGLAGLGRRLRVVACGGPC